MANRGERAPERSDALLPILMGCGALVVLMCGGGLAAYSLLAIPPAVVLPSSGPPVPVPVPPVPLPVVAPPSPPVLPATPEPEPPPTDVGAEVQGALSHEVIQRIVRRHLGEVRECYERSLVSDPDLTARVVAHFTIGDDGTVTTASVDGSSDVPLTTCIASRVRAWVFPAPEGGGIVVINYPFVLTPS